MLLGRYEKYLILLNLKSNIRAWIFVKLAFITTVLALSNTVIAEPYDDFSCTNGDEVSLGVPIGVGGWGNVGALTDDNAWTVWSANYPSLATATMDLNSSQTISQVSVFENIFLPGAQKIDVTFVKVGGGTETIQIDLLNSTPQNQWHNLNNLDIPNVISVVFSRDHASENVAQIKVCNKQNTPPLFIDNVEVNEGETASFTVSGSGNFSYSLDFNNSTDASDFTGSISGSGTAPATINIQTNDDTISESTETFNVNLSAGSTVLATGQGTILDNDNGLGCSFKPSTNLQGCLPWDVDSGVTVNVDQAMYLKWRLLAVHKGPNMSITANDIATYGQSSNGTNCFDRHDKYWTLGDDGFAYHTWHPADDGVCVYGHEHGDDPNPLNPATAGDQYLDPETGIHRKSQAFIYAKGANGSSYPPFGFAMMVYNRNVSDSNSPNKKRREDHFGHKVIIANGIRMAIGDPQNIGSDIYDTGIRCDWYSKIHQGSFSPDALTNNMHEYFLNIVCNDGTPIQDDHPKRYNNILASRNDVTKISFKTMLNWGNPYLINELGATKMCQKSNNDPTQCAPNSIENANVWRADIPRKNNYDSISIWSHNPKKYQANGNSTGFECKNWNNIGGSDSYFSTVWSKLAREDLNLPDCIDKRQGISSKINKLWLQANGTPILDDIPALDTKPSPLALDYAESGSRDLELFSSFVWKNNWDRWFTNGNNGFDYDGISAPELWSGPSGNQFKTFGAGGLRFAPYYIVKNPSRMLSTANNGVELERTVKLCKSNIINKAFCKATNNNSADWKNSKFFNGSVRALNFKAIHLNNRNGKTEWCTNAIGENIDTTIPMTANPLINVCNDIKKQIRQKTSDIDNGWQGYGNRVRTVCDTNGNHCGKAIVGTIERWSIDHQNGQWIIERKKAQKNPNDQSSAAYKGAGMGYEWIINHGNDNGVRVPN